MTSLTLEKANTIINVALATARTLNLAPLTVVVLDDAGHLKAMQREDGSTMIRQQVATAKAWGSVSMGMSSRSLADVAEQRPNFMNALVNIADGKVMPVPGGILIRDHNNRIIGAVGISGDVSDEDERCAIAGVKAAGF
ncbi:MAG: heme-binding protein [Methylicorpusculum sp.]|uniref:GlcG/HbpS family heme-binding protein n=1 Tax=Methylicorpusculum sp. TaxID=2713644 RepID=UPI002721D4E0|nr:heme-binding protein [Methylicorpusculum sp.]MDO8845304.1 heme-binding protein [Methylicorpusculum sp.]MDO8940955.1 heme-binding protein [Methylicorpusculum sp.]MDO9240832.1 heme-binding protein [Methylicorpusculum sp.]MDP2200848.1 heme-binding protein [Methylicorpusculum sp.]